MPEPIHPAEVEELMKDIANIPEPDAEFITTLRARFIAEGQASANTNQEKKMNRNKFSPRLIWALVIILLAVFILLATSPQVVTALKKMFGYIPDVGVVEQTTSLRVLAEPVSVEREGIRVTIAQVAADSARTIIRYKVEWLTPPVTDGEYDASCQGMPGLALADGSLLSFVQTTDKFMAGAPGSNSGYGYTMEFAPIPSDRNDATFNLPCLVPLATGALPRDWQITFHLIPAPAGTMLPVETVNATATPPAEVVTATVLATSEVDSTHGIRISVDRFVALADGYLLTGSLQWDEQNFPAATTIDPVSGIYLGVLPIPDSIKITDANGQEVPYEQVYGPETPRNEDYRSYWTIKTHGKNFQAPLTISMSSVEVRPRPLSFFIHAGASPMDGQNIEINQDLQIAGSAVHVQKAQLQKTSDGMWSLLFDLAVDPSQIGDVSLLLLPVSPCGGGGGYPTEHLSLIQAYVGTCISTLPADPVEIRITSAVLWGSWQIRWSP